MESDVRDIKQQINQMARSDQFYSLNSTVGNLERTVRETSSAFDGIRHELEMLQEEVRQMKGDIIVGELYASNV